MRCMTLIQINSRLLLLFDIHMQWHVLSRKKLYEFLFRIAKLPHPPFSHRHGTRKIEAPILAATFSRSSFLDDFICWQIRAHLEVRFESKPDILVPSPSGNSADVFIDHIHFFSSPRKDVISLPIFLFHRGILCLDGNSQECPKLCENSWGSLYLCVYYRSALAFMTDDVDYIGAERFYRCRISFTMLNIYWISSARAPGAIGFKCRSHTAAKTQQARYLCNEISFSVYF